MKKNAYKKFLPAVLLAGVLLAAFFSIGALAGGTEEGAWEKKNGKWYYFDADGAMQTGWLALGESRYYLNGSGAMQTGWVKTDGSWYYFSSTGAMQTGWIKSYSKWYYLNADGAMQTGWLEWAGNHYYMNGSGVMQTGWLKLDGAWYYFSSTGAMQTGWIKSYSKWYYLNADGVMQTGWLEWQDNLYYLKENGAMQTGWAYLNDSWYWFSSAGNAASGWRKINNDWYYFYTEEDPGGPCYTMAADTEIDGYVIRATGVAIHDAELTMIQKAASETSTTDWLILVDTSACKTGVFYKTSSGEWTLYKFWNCTPGAAGTPTVKGRFTVKSRGYSFGSSTYVCYYFVQIYGNYLFHSVLYNRDGSVRDGRLGQNLSHGCVRLAWSNAKWLYDNIPKGTKVYIY